MVQDAAQAKQLVPAALASLVIALAGCGGDPPVPQGVGGNTPLRLANCDDWNDSGVEERLVTVTQLRKLNEEKALAEAKKTGKPIFVVFRCER